MQKMSIGELSDNSISNTKSPKTRSSGRVIRIQKMIGDNSLSSPLPTDDVMDPARKRAFSSNSNPSSRGGTGSPTTTLGRFKQQILDRDRMYAYTRDELIHKIVDKYMWANFNKWFIRTPVPDDEGNFEKSEKLVKALERSDRSSQFQKNIGLAYRLGLIERAAFMGIGYIEPVGTSTESPPTEATGIAYLVPIRKDQVNAMKYFPEGTDRFGEPMLYELTQETSSGTPRKYFVHADRMVIIAPFQFDDNIFGMSIIDHIFDQFLIKKDMDWQKGEKSRRHHIPLLEVMYPDDDDAQTYAEANFKDGWEGKDVFAHSAEEGWDLKLHEITGSFPFDEYYKWTVDLMAAGGYVPRTHVIGTGEGTVSGSEVNTQSFFSDISANQNINITPMVIDFDKKRFLAGALAEFGYDDEEFADYKVEWNPAFELTGKELAQKNRLDAIADKAWVETGTYTINELRKMKGEPPSDNPFADRLLYKGIPLEEYWLTQMPPEPEEEEEEENPDESEEGPADDPDDPEQEEEPDDKDGESVTPEENLELI